LNGLSLFSGGGIGELAFKYTIPNYRTVGYVDNDEYCCKVIEARIKDGILDDAPIWQVDIREFNRKIAQIYKGKVDCISGGFPCQPFSVAGRQLGEADERNMWPATIEAIRIIRPTYIFLENVPALLAHEYIRRIFGDLAESGYDCEWDVVSAAFVGAPHLRKRLWILAYAESEGLEGRQENDGREVDRREWGAMGNEFRPVCQDVADTSSDRMEGAESVCEMGETAQSIRYSWWSVEPDVGRVAHGVANRVDRLKTLGNGWVPQVVKRILQVKELAL